MTLATTRAYAVDAAGIRRLVAAPGDVIPTSPRTYGVITTPDGVAAAVLPLDGYDLLEEDAILAILPGLDPDELAAVQAYEKAHQARGSITRYGTKSNVVTSGIKQRRKVRSMLPDQRPSTELDDIDVQIPAISTSEGYDGMATVDLQAEVDRRVAAGAVINVRGTGAKGKVLKADLVTALQTADANIDE